MPAPAIVDFNTFPHNTVIIFLDGRVYLKAGGVYLHLNPVDNHGSPVDDADLANERIPPGSRAVISGRQYIKDTKNIWRLVDPLPADFDESESVHDVAPRLPVNAATSGTGIVLTTTGDHPEINHVLILDQTHGQQANAVAMNQAVFNVPITAAEQGLVHNPAGAAFTGEFATHAKASIVFGIEGMGSNQRNMQYNGRPITREKLAKVISEELKKKIEEKGPLWYEGEVLAFERLFLITVERITQGSILARLGIMVP